MSKNILILISFWFGGFMKFMWWCAWRSCVKAAPRDVSLLSFHTPRYNCFPDYVSFSLYTIGIMHSIQQWFVRRLNAPSLDAYSWRVPYTIDIKASSIHKIGFRNFFFPSSLYVKFSVLTTNIGNSDAENDALKQDLQKSPCGLKEYFF